MKGSGERFWSIEGLRVDEKGLRLNVYNLKKGLDVEHKWVNLGRQTIISRLKRQCPRSSVTISLSYLAALAKTLLPSAGFAL
jgi:hypothetical protein